MRRMFFGSLSAWRGGFTIAVVVMAIGVSGLTNAGAQEPDGRGFATPDQAVKALQGALAARDINELGGIFGPALSDIINPDLVAATNEFEAAAAALEESNTLVEGGKGRMILQFGRDETLFPVPLVERAGKWHFDTVAGIEELINRRIGRNELTVLEIIRTYVQAQREYASKDRDGDEVLEYAQKFRSTPGKRDGLYWDPEIDGTLSPLGPLFAEAESEGYRRRTEVVTRRAFHGYYFKILTRQGKGAPGGAYDYIINGNMIGGFALVAWPAEYDQTGVMTFVVNQQGRVYQKDLGKDTDQRAEALRGYDLDGTWVPSVD